MKNIVILCNSLEYLISHREFLVDALSKRFRVHIIGDSGSLSWNRSEVSIHNLGPNSLVNWIKIRSLVNHLDPVAIHALTFSSIVFSGLLLRGRGRNFLFSVSGFGVLAVSIERGMFLRAVGWLLKRLYVFSLRNSTVFVQNSSDAFFLDSRCSNVKLVKTLGVGLAKSEIASPRRVQSGKGLSCVCGTRILLSKGVLDLAEFAEVLVESKSKHRVTLYGKRDDKHIDSPSAKQWARLRSSPLEYMGFSSSMSSLLGMYDICLFLSTYGEGVPKFVIECIGSGVPVLGYDCPGLNEVVIPGETGFLVEPRDWRGLLEKLEVLSNAEEYARMSSNCIEFALNHLSRDLVLDAHMSEYDLVK